MSTTTTLKITPLYANLPADQAYIEDIYDNLDDAIAQHPDQQIIVGYCIIDTDTNEICVGTNDWYETYNKAEIALDEITNQNNEPTELYALRPSKDWKTIQHIIIRAKHKITRDDLNLLVNQMLNVYATEHNLSTTQRNDITWDDAIDIALKYPKLCDDFGFKVIISNENKVNLNDTLSD